VRTSLLELPVSDVELPVWSAETSATWESHARRASTITARAGTGKNFGVLVAEARALLMANDVATLLARVVDRRFVRALFTAWSDEALARHTMTPELLQGVSEKGSFSRLGSVRAASLLLEHFDLLDTWHRGLFGATAHVVRHSVVTQPTRDRRDLVESLRANEFAVFAPDGPQRLASWLVDLGTEPGVWMRAQGLRPYVDSRFGRVTRDAYFLAWITAADPNTADGTYLKTISDEVVARQRTETTGTDGRYFGHHVLEALAAKDTRHPSAAWLEAVLAIGGDPRMKDTPQWKTWWAHISPEAVQRAVRWMQGVNLKAFLDGVDEYARATGNTDMQRMLERRRRFLIGLYEQDRVHDVRLILGDDIRRWITRTSEVSIDYATLGGSSTAETAIVYVHGDDFSLVEGSHNFRLHIYIGGPVPPIADRRYRHYDVADLRDRYPSRHIQVHGPRAYLGVAHQGGEWIRKSLDFLRSRGIRLDERALLTPNDYADLARRRAGW